MAVSKIRKTSSTVLLVIAILAVIIMAVFFFGGYIDPTAAKPEPKFANLLIYTCYAVFVAALVVLFYFAIIGFAGKFKTNPKGAMMGLAMIVGIVALLGITYAVGSTDRLPVGPDAQKYNVDGYLKFSDMMLYSIYVMFAMTICALIWGAVRNALAGKK